MLISDWSSDVCSSVLRMGGVVNVRSLTDSVAPLPSGSINPYVPQVIAMVDSDREDTTGISRLSQGLDKKALSHQNSAGLVEQLTSNSQGRTKIIARNFALQFVSQLYLKVYQLVIEKATEEKLIENAGNFRSEEHTSELQSLMRISYAVFCLKKKT